MIKCYELKVSQQTGRLKHNLLISQIKHSIQSPKIANLAPFMYNNITNRNEPILTLLPCQTPILDKLQDPYFPNA
jgi:hypothetical protein